MTQLKYKEIEKEMRQLAQTLPVGAKIPPERHLAVTYECNFLTVRKALKSLVDDGTIIRRVGSGSFVGEHRNGKQASPTVRKENRIGILVFQNGNLYAYKVLEALAHVALTESIELRSGWIGGYRDDALRQAELLAKEGCVALTLPWFPLEMMDEVKQFVWKCPLPVSLPMAIPGLEKNSFEKPEIFGSSIISTTQTLCSYHHLLGHRRIALLGPDAPKDIVLQQTLSSYTSFVSRNDLPNICGLVDQGSQSMNALAQRWMKFKGDLAVISYDDEHALRFMTSMHKLGLGAPDDFTINGYNNTDASHFSDPPLSTICQNFEYAATWLLKSALGLSKGIVTQSPKSPPLRLLVRSTCGGLGKINEEFQARLPDLEIVLKNKPLAAKKEEPLRVS